MTHDIQPRGSKEDGENNLCLVRKATWIGLGVNVFLAGFKLAAGLIGASQAVVADALHSLSDTVTDVAVLVGSRYWSRPPAAISRYSTRPSTACPWATKSTWCSPASRLRSTSTAR